METKDFRVSLFDGNGWWLPVDQNIMFDYVLPNSAESPLETSPADAMYSRENGYEEMELHEIYETESLAKFAFSILWQAAEFSLEHGTVIVYDF